MREVLRVLLFMAILVVICVIALGVCFYAFGAEQETPEQQAWKQYEEAAAKAGAGEHVPTPDELIDLEPWKAGCKKEYCPSIIDGVNAGRKWCHNPNKKCHTSHRYRSFDIWAEWMPWIEESSGGFPGLLIAGTVRTESENQVDGKTNSSTGECGLASVDLKHAQKHDVNACDPRANLHVAGKARNNRLINLRGKFPQLFLADLEQQWMLAGACGAVGTNKVEALIELSGALQVKEDGTLRWAKPYDRVLDWMKWAHRQWAKASNLYAGDPWEVYKSPHLSKYLQLYQEGGPFAHAFGTKPGKVAFRVSRVSGQVELLRDLYPNGIPWGQPVIPIRPMTIHDFPGVGKHCACGLWPGLLQSRPAEAEIVKWLDVLDGTAPVDPATLAVQ